MTTKKLVIDHVRILYSPRVDIIAEGDEYSEYDPEEKLWSKGDVLSKRGVVGAHMVNGQDLPDDLHEQLKLFLAGVEVGQGFLYRQPAEEGSEHGD